MQVEALALIAALVPGAVDPTATAAKVCTPGYTKTVRPPASFTNKLKRSQLSPGTNLRLYEEDHRVPLEVGGAPRDPKNLWPEPWPDAHAKDALENRVHKKLCLGQISIRDAQAFFLGPYWRTPGL